MALLLIVLLVAVPVLELYVILQVGQLVGPLWTVLLLVAISLVGGVLVRREGLRAWQRLRQALEEGRVPAAEVVEGFMLLLGGALLLTPGFVTDGVGLALVVPVTRVALRALLRRRVEALARPSGAASQRSGRTGAARADVDVEVVRVERHDPPRTAPPSLDDPDAER